MQPHVQCLLGKCRHAPEYIILQELVLRYEALSLAVSQLHMQTQTEPSIQPTAVSSAHGSQQSMPAAAQQESAYAVGPVRDSPRHLLASRQPEKAHEPMFGAAQPQSDATNAPGTSALLQVSSLPFRCVAHLVLVLGCAQPSHDMVHMRTLAAAPPTQIALAVILVMTRTALHVRLKLSVQLRLQEACDTAHEAAEAVLEPQTSARFYSEESEAVAQTQPNDSSSLVAQPETEDDRFLSLATGEAQADATDVGKPPAESRAHDVAAFQKQLDLAPDHHAAEHPSMLAGSTEHGMQPESALGDNEAGQGAPSAAVHTPTTDYIADDEASIDQLR